MSDYIICYDRDGTPYIEHGWRNHKYIRIENGNYIYPKDVEKARKNNVAYAKEQQKKANKEMNKAVRSANRNYRKMKKLKDSTDFSKKKSEMTPADLRKKAQYDKLVEANKEDIKKRADLNTKKHWADREVKISKKEYEAAREATKKASEADKKYKASQRRRKLSNFINNKAKHPFSKIENPKI